MQVFKAFYMIVRRNMGAMLMYVVIFLGLCILFTGNGESNSNVFKETSAEVGIVDLDGGSVAKALIEYMSEIHHVTMMEYEKEEMIESLYFYNAEYILLIPENFSTKFMEGNAPKLETYHTPDSYSDMILSGQVEQFLSIYRMYSKMGLGDDEVLEKALQNMKIETEITIAGKGTVYSSAYYFCRYLSYIFIAVLITGLGPVLIRFRDKEIDARNSCSFLSKTKQSIQISLGAVSFSLLVFVLFMLMMFVLYGRTMGSDWWVYVLNALCIHLVATSITLFLSAFSLNTNMLNMLSNVIGMGMAFLGGVFVDLSIMDKNVLKFSRLLPSYWNVNVLDRLANSVGGIPYEDILPAMGIQCLYAVAFFALSLVARKVIKTRR